MDHAPGARLGRYEIQSLLGKGGMGDVYLAIDTQLRRPVALKLLRPDASPERLRRFEREALAVSALNHPNILTLYEVATDQGQPFLVTEHVDGESLRQRLSAKRLDLRDALEIALQVATALAAAHAAGVVHRDLKPENIMVRRDGWVKVLDFGLAKLLSEREPSAPGGDSPSETAPGVLLGTPFYMSPEQTRGLPVDARTDVWAFGCVLYEMVCGQMPFGGATTGDVIAAVLRADPPAVRARAPGAPESLQKLIARTLCKERDARPTDAGALLAPLRQLKVQAELETRLGGGAVASDFAAAPPYPAPTWISTLSGGVRRHKRPAIALVFILVAGVIGHFLSSALQTEASVAAVAVLSFAPAEPGSELEYLGDGLAESLIRDLSRFSGLRVIARSSAFRYKGKPFDPREVGRDLGVQALVTGRVQREGDGLRISAELIDTRDGTHLWSDNYVRRPADFQGIQAEITRRVGAVLRPRSSLPSAPRPPVDPEAYQLYLNGLHHMRSQGEERARKALDFFNRAMTIEPRFALAWVGVANAYEFQAMNGFADANEAMTLMKAAAAHAVEADPDLADAQLAVAKVRRHEWHWTGAEAACRRALELDPNLASAHLSYAYLLVVTNRLDDAIVSVRRAQELDPLRAELRAFEAQMLYFGRRYAEGERLVRKVLEANADDRAARIILAFLLEGQKRFAEAEAEYRKMLALEPNSTAVKVCLAHLLAVAGRRDEARAMLQEFLTGREYVAPTALATIYIGLEDYETAFAYLQKAYDARDLQLQNLGVDPDFDPIQSDPRYGKLLQKVGLPRRS